MLNVTFVLPDKSLLDHLLLDREGPDKKKNIRRQEYQTNIRYDNFGQQKCSLIKFVIYIAENIITR